MFRVHFKAFCLGQPLKMEVPYDGRRSPSSLQRTWISVGTFFQRICLTRLRLLSWGAIFPIVCLVGCFSNSETKWVEQQGLKNRSIALLENGAEGDKDGKMLNEAIDGFRKLAVQLPNERLGVQNLCVALLARLKTTDAVDDPTTFASIGKELEKALDALRRLSPNEPDADVFESRYRQERGERELAIQSLRTATQKKNATADTFSQLIQLLQAESKPENVSEIRTLLESAILLAPNNLVLSVQLLDVMAKTQDVKFSELAERCRELFRPLMSRTNSRIPTLMDNAVAAAGKDDWRTAQTQVAFLRNVLLAELAYQNDLHLLEPHNLEYVQLEFESEKSKPPARRAVVSPQRFLPSEGLPFASKNLSAIATEDFDLDGHFDLFCAAGKQLDIWSVHGSQAAKNLASIPLEIECRGIVLADLDHDYQYRKDALPPSALPTTATPGSEPPLQSNLVDTDVDLIAFGEDGIRLYRNDLDAATGQRSLTAMPQSDGFSALLGIRTVAVIDLDHDSDLDLVVSSSSGVSFWSNRGDWTFADFTPFSTLPSSSAKIDSILALDLDRNVLNDFLLGSEELEEPMMLANNLHGRYQIRDLSWKRELASVGRAMEAIDANADACWDVVACGKNGTKLATMKSVGRHGWVSNHVSTLSTKPMIGLSVIDVDNDGYADCIAWGSAGMELYRGGTDGKLMLDAGALSIRESIIQAVPLDVDRDGDEDLVCLNADGSLRFLDNQGGNANQQLEVVIRADEDGKQRPRERCNMHGVGSLIELKSSGTYQPRIVRGTRTKFGIGKQKGADIMRVLWTNGIPNNVLNVKNSSTVFDQQNLGGSCPYLYAWNGERFEFCTDCLWAAPIGLQFAQGVSAPTREWEYLKIDGQLIRPRNGRYVLQATEELWEAAYFDSVQLMAVDHPKEIEVFTNEKVGPPDLAAFRVHTVENRRAAKSVTDHRGNVVTELVSKRDQRFTKSWSEGFNQGLVEDHWLEIDMNDSDERTDQLTLFLTGWVFPTCTSLNLAMTENPLRPKLKPPGVQVPDDQGNWVEVIPYAGFPGGKTKTIAIDLTGKFVSNDHRVRIVTNMELCWDEVFWTRNEGSDTSKYRLSNLKLESADLHFRGFSELVPQAGNAPKRFEYANVTKESIWPPMSGNFTRFGDVKELIEEADDLQVVMGAGDELTLEFSTETAPVPEGWVRDFIVYNVGWDKDADLNTIHGQSVEPLPFRSMKRYPYEPDETFPSTSKHIDFLEQFQTRKQNLGLFWDQIRDASR
jgi:tetratricopeptide (TPR) repeat protein